MKFFKLLEEIKELKALNESILEENRRLIGTLCQEKTRNADREFELNTRIRELEKEIKESVNIINTEEALEDVDPLFEDE